MKSQPAANLWTMIATAPPAYMYGISQVRVTTPGGTSSLASWNNPYYDDYFYAAPPSISAVSPSAGPLAGGTQVLITGSNLAGHAGGGIRQCAGAQFHLQLRQRHNHRRQPRRGRGHGPRDRDHGGRFDNGGGL